MLGKGSLSIHVMDLQALGRHRGGGGRGRANPNLAIGKGARNWRELVGTSTWLFFFFNLATSKVSLTTA